MSKNYATDSNRCRDRRSWQRWIVVLIALSLGCDRYRTGAEEPSALAASRSNGAGEISEDHAHRGGVPTSVLTSLGRDEYHAEAVMQEDGRLEIFVFGADETRLQEVDNQSLTAYLKSANRSVSTVIVLTADPVPGDAEHKTTRFSGTLPDQFRKGSLSITVPGLRIEGQRFTARFALIDSLDAMMPTGVGNDQAQDLYLTSGGIYTEKDIEANGRMTAATFYQNFRAEHDANPQTGDWLCPITFTKANPKCHWIIGGEKYYFCCPPCIDEFLTWAKTEPDRIKLPSDYIK